jgi:ThiF family
MSTATPIDRTVRLIRGDLFPGLSMEELTEELSSTVAVLRADEANLASEAGQTALVACFVCLAQLGIEVVLDLPDVPLWGVQPPLRGDRLGAALFDLGNDLILPPAMQATRPPTATVLLGDTPAPSGAVEPVLRLGGGDWAARVEPGARSVVPRLGGRVPFAPILAAAACAAEILRIALARIAVTHDLAVPGEFDLGPPHRVSIDLPALDIPARIELGEADVVSAGAITNGCLFALLRVRGLDGSLRVFDRDLAELTNLNRYPLLRRSQLGRLKVDLLAEASTAELRIEPLARRLARGSIPRLRERVLVGVDDIPSRWVVQEHAPGWLCVAGTSHFTAIVSEHEPGMPCAGCLHPRDDPTAPQRLPTISFTSLIAGTLQGYRLIAHLLGRPPATPTLAATFNLSAPRAFDSIGLAANPACPLGCGAGAMAA